MVKIKLRHSASQLFSREFSRKKLENTYDKYINNHSTPGIDGISADTFKKNISSHIELIHKKVENNSYNFSQYKEKLILKSAHKYPRIISIPTTRDKLVLKALSIILIELFGDNFLSLHELVNDAIKSYKSGNFDYLIRLDIIDYYPSINHEKLFEQIHKKIRKVEITTLLQKAISQSTVSKPCHQIQQNNVGVPQGLSISNILANIYFLPIDYKYYASSTFRYYRYADDIIIFCKKEDSTQIYKDFQKDIQELQVTLHPPKDKDKFLMADIAQGFNYLGYHFEKNEISIKKENVEKFCASIIRYFTSYKYAKKKNLDLLIFILNLRITGCVVDQKKYGWIFYFSQITDKKILYGLDEFISDQISRFGLASYQNQIKKINRSYFEVTKNFTKTKYIPKFDYYSPSEINNIVSEIFKININGMTDQTIKNIFHKKIFQCIKDIEKDFSRLS